MAAERVRTLLVGSEEAMLSSWLDWHRATLESKCSDLTDDQLRERSAPLSTMCLLGLVRHMAEVERLWFRKVVGREDLSSIWEDDDDLGMNATPSADVRGAFEAWHEEIAKSREVEASVVSLDEVFSHHRRGDLSFRWVMIHMIEEYARHNGHADLLRERIDGKTGH